MMEISSTVLSLVLVIATTLGGSTRLVEAVCFFEREIASPSEHDAYTCWSSRDLVEDLERLPIENQTLSVSFLDSDIRKIERDDLQKLGTKAVSLSLKHCRLERVDDQAFHGLSELKALELRGNRIDCVSVDWFRDLDKLESLDLSGNMIREFDVTIFDLLPTMQDFDISDNQLTRFDVQAMENSWPRLKKVGLRQNPYDWLHVVRVSRYLTRHSEIAKNSYRSIDGLRETSRLAEGCLNSTGSEDNNKLDDCVSEILSKAIDSPEILIYEESL